ncbi:NADH-quinone oxidoreductase subunit NuoK [SAR202 cluster bacterium AD-802-E10_MRT_200m]|nr:NADH-quinone oxidoreductase subunit NuoK [SAR202 cluster bacterium AD-802-E10_MRT_200m]
MIGLTHYLGLSAVLFSLGVCGILSKRNAIAILMSIELLFNAVNVALVAFARHTVPSVLMQGDIQVLLTGQIFAVFVIAVAAAEVALGLAIVIAIYRSRETVDVSEINVMSR